MPIRHAFPFATGSKITPTQLQSANGSRLTHIDAIRGLLLVFMAVNHIPSDLHVVTDHPLGFMSAAEGFVFMAGLMAGCVYTRKWLCGNFHELRRACTGRALTIYRWHVLAYVLVFAGLVAVGFCTGALPLNTPPALLEHPVLSVVGGLLLVQQPTLFDILPMYCVLLIATPRLLRVCSYTGGYPRLIFGSLTLWAAANLFSPQVPFDNSLINTGAFNLASWQLLYVGGLAFGHRWASREQTADRASNAQPDYLLSRPSAPALIGWVTMAAVLFSVRHGFLPSGLSEPYLGAVTNKNNLAPLRLLDTALILYLGYQLVSYFPQMFSWRPLAWIGRASLAVFSTHVFAAYAIHAFPEIFAETNAGRWCGTALMTVAIVLAAAVHGHLVHQNTPPTRPATGALYSKLASRAPADSSSGMNLDRLSRQIRFIAEVDKLKEIFRQTLCTQSRRQENDAEHSWHLALLVIVLAEHSNHQPLDVLRVLKMVIIHDLVEIDAGDTFAYDTVRMADQHQREACAAERIFGLLPDDQCADFRSLWDEFEARLTPESRFAAAVDRFQPMLLNCLTDGAAWQKHGVTSDRVIARNKHIEQGSTPLWEYASRMINEAVTSGTLAK